MCICRGQIEFAAIDAVEFKDLFCQTQAYAFNIDSWTTQLLG